MSPRLDSISDRLFPKDVVLVVFAKQERGDSSEEAKRHQTGIFLILENKHAILQNYTKDFLNNEEHRKELTTNGKIALLSAVWFWNDKKCYQIADKQTNDNANEIVKQITKKVNGGYNGLDKRTKQHTRIKNASQSK